MRFLFFALMVCGVAVLLVASFFLGHFTSPVDKNLLIETEVPRMEKATTTDPTTIPTPYGFRGPTGKPYIIGPRNDPPNY
ncbi:MAG: hypothetical protein AAB495_04705 [Patescibacteria group bacterium]